MTEESSSLIEKAAHTLQHSKKIVVFTGAGVSKESGIPTFRDPQTGLWAQYSPQDLATREGFLKNPKLVWEWYDFRRNKVWETEPNAGHYALSRLEDWVLQSPEGKTFTLITQNIDNLHHKAGNQNLLELHGNIFHYKCLDREHPYILNDEEGQETLPPKCPLCQSFIRPDVVWFNEALPEEPWKQAFHQSQVAEAMVIIGTSGWVQPAASLPLQAKEAGAVLIEVNPEPSHLTRWVDIFLQGPSSIILPDLVDAIISP